MASGTTGGTGVRSADGRNPSTNHRATAEQGSPSYSAEQREPLRRGLALPGHDDSSHPSAASVVPIRGLHRKAGAETAPASQVQKALRAVGRSLKVEITAA